MPNTHARRLTMETKALRGSLRSLDRSLRRFVPILTAAIQIGKAAEPSVRRPVLSAKARASLVLQGRYMGFVRQLKPKQKAQVRKVRETKGVRVAIATARRLSA
jgi:hypothetical protein